MPHVSVLLPYRDGAATLRAALGSLLAERLPALEVIAVDDGSSDAGPAIVAELAQRDARIVPLKSNGRGIVAALDLAARHARGRWLARMDADDVSLPGRFEAQLAALEENRTLGAIGTQVEAFPADQVGDGLRRYVAWQNGLHTPEDHLRDLFVESPLCHPSALMRREAFEMAGGYRDDGFAEDYDLWLRMVAAGWSLSKVSRVLLRWRHREGRLTFTDPRYSPERMRSLKAYHLAPLLERRGRELVIWGAGPTGRRLARALEPHGWHASAFVDVDPRKLGRTARGAPIVAPSQLRRGSATVLVAVGSAGARALIRGELDRLGFQEGADYLCTA